MRYGGGDPQPAGPTILVLRSHPRQGQGSVESAVGATTKERAGRAEWGYPGRELSERRLRVRPSPCEGTGGSVCRVWASARVFLSWASEVRSGVRRLHGSARSESSCQGRPQMCDKAYSDVPRRSGLSLASD